MDNEETPDLQPIMLGTNICVTVNKPHLKQSRVQVGHLISLWWYSAFTCLCIDVQRSQGCAARYGETVSFCGYFWTINYIFIGGVPANVVGQLNVSIACKQLELVINYSSYYHININLCKSVVRHINCWRLCSCSYPLNDAAETVHQLGCSIRSVTGGTSGIL